MGFNSVYKSLKELFPEIDSKILRAIAIEHPYNADEAAESVFLSEIVPYLSPNFTKSENKSSEENLPVCKVEPVEGNLSLNQWLNPSKVPQSFLALLNEDESSTPTPPEEKTPAHLDYVVKKVVLPSGGGGGIRTLFSASDKTGSSSSSSSMVKPSIRVRSQTKTENISGSSSKAKRSSHESILPVYHDYTEKLRSWKKRNSNYNRRDYSYLFGKHEDDLPSKQSNKSKHKAYATERDRKQRIDDNIKALAELLPNEVKEKDSPESILNDVIAHVKLLQLQMKDLSRSRLAEEAVTHPMTYIEGYGHFIHHEKTMTKPLEEVMADLLVNDPEAAKSLLESKGLYLMPLSSVQRFC